MMNRISKFRSATELLGNYAIEPERFRQAVDTAMKMLEVGALDDDFDEDRDQNEERRRYDVQDGVATIEIAGVLSKHRSSLGSPSSSYLEIRRALRQADVDDAVRSVLLVIDSPGGNVAGMTDLADDIYMMVKPVVAFAEDMAASAAYLAMSQADYKLVNRGGEVGSIGAFAVVHDVSKRFEREGIKTIVVSSGEYKGLGQPGTEIDEKTIAKIKEDIDGIHASFVADVSRGVGMTVEEVDALADGRVFRGQDAVDVGLVDRVSSLDDAFELARREGVTTMTNEEMIEDIVQNREEVAEHFKREGVTVESKRVAEMIERFGEHPAFACDMIVEGKTASEAATAFAAYLNEELEQARGEIARLNAAMEDGADAVALADVSAEDEDGDEADDDSPETIAKSEWDANLNDCRDRFSSERTYVAARLAEMNGSLRVTSRERAD